MVPQIEIDDCNNDFYSLNSDWFDNSDSDNMLQLPSWEYQSVDDIKNTLEENEKSLFLLHNIRSLSKNIDCLNDNI